MRLGYYAQAPFVRASTGPLLFPDIAGMCEGLSRWCKRFVCFFNSVETLSYQSHPLPSQVELVDLGPLPAHWQRALGFRVPFSTFEAYGKQLDAIILQGPTSMLPHIARSVRPALPVYFLIGFWTPPQKLDFKVFGPVKRFGLRLLAHFSEWDHRRVYPLGVITGNNPLMGEMYAHLAPFHLVRRSLIRDDQLTGVADRPLHNPVRLLSMGRVDPEKHLETIIEAAALLNGRLDFRLDIVGGGHPLYRVYLQQKVADSGLSDIVRLHPNVPFEETHRFYEQADLFIFHTGSTEGFPKTIWEAFAAGVPVISAEFPGATGILKHAEQALLFPRLDANSLAERVLGAVGNERLRRQLRRNGYCLLKESTLDFACRRIAEITRAALDHSR